MVLWRLIGGHVIGPLNVVVVGAQWKGVEWPKRLAL